MEAEVREVVILSANMAKCEAKFGTIEQLLPPPSHDHDEMMMKYNEYKREKIAK